MIGVILVIHSLVAILLVVIILMQSGRGGGLTESFASAEAMFGAKTNQVLVQGTVILATLFLVTSLSLAYLSARQDRSLIQLTADKVVPEKGAQKAVTDAAQEVKAQAESQAAAPAKTALEDIADPADTQPAPAP